LERIKKDLRTIPGGPGNCCTSACAYGFVFLKFVWPFALAILLATFFRRLQVLFLTCFVALLALATLPEGEDKWRAIPWVCFGLTCESIGYCFWYYAPQILGEVPE
jgi:hypothetical protein